MGWLEDTEDYVREFVQSPSEQERSDSRVGVLSDNLPRGSGHFFKKILLTSLFLCL